MIPNVTKGGNMYGLIHYLQGKGKYNEHENPHIVAGDDFLAAWYGTEMLERSSVKEIGDYLEAPRKHFGTTVRAQVTEQDPETGAKVVTGYRDAHVWHCSLSLPAEDGPLSNEQWQQVAGDFMDRMGFTDASGKAPCRWVAIHHGKSKNGNDHIHIAASMVREDGTRWEGRYRDYKSAQEACREIEKARGLSTVKGPDLDVVERGEKPAERRQAQRANLTSTAPKELGHRIRAAAVASSSEAEWIRRVRADGVIVKPFFAKGTTDVVSGYRAALKPEEYGEKLAFYGGGTIGRDLTLPRLRENWSAPSVEQAEAAAAEWQAAFRGQRPVGAGVETRAFGAKAPDVAAANFKAFNERLVMTPYGDRAAWADAARDVSGALSAWARYDKENAVDLRAAASTLARSAQYNRKAMPPGRRVKESPMGTAFIFMAAKPGDQAKIAGALLMRQLMTTAKALAAHHRALGDLRHAQALERDVVARLERIRLIGYRSLEADAQGARATAERGGVPTVQRPAHDEARRAADAFGSRGAMQGYEQEQGSDGPSQQGRPGAPVAPEPGRDPLPRPLGEPRRPTPVAPAVPGEQPGQRPAPHREPGRSTGRSTERGGDKHER